ncbi:MAG: KAP family NTPase [Chloroflexota bacterium]|nr:KAP family NTPase [Chloroflexota bacterium]
MWSDNEADVDLLRFKYLASAVSRIIGTRHLLPTTIGVFGDWGSGKSSLLKMVQADLERDPAIMWLGFNGWLFEGYEDAKTALIGTILDAIDERASSNQTVSDKARALLDKLMKRVNWLQIASLAGRHLLPAVAGLPHLSMASLGVDAWQALQATPGAVAAALPNMNLEDAQKLIKDAPDGPEQVRRNIRDFRQDFAALLKEAKIETLVVFIDDLDRCLPDTIIETLEAIKLFLFVPGTAFVLGADRRLVEYAVRQRFPELPA